VVFKARIVEATTRIVVTDSHVIPLLVNVYQTSLLVVALEEDALILKLNVQTSVGRISKPITKLDMIVLTVVVSAYQKFSARKKMKKVIVPHMVLVNVS
jgi:hypothetical protein